MQDGGEVHEESSYIMEGGSELNMQSSQHSKSNSNNIAAANRSPSKNARDNVAHDEKSKLA